MRTLALVLQLLGVAEEVIPEIIAIVNQAKNPANVTQAEAHVKAAGPTA